MPHVTLCSLYISPRLIILCKMLLCQVKELVKNKQLEFVNAGWCMNDEAGAHYNSIIDQMTVGKKLIDI